MNNTVVWKLWGFFPFFLILSGWFTMPDSCREHAEVQMVLLQDPQTRDAPGYKWALMFQKELFLR